MSYLSHILVAAVLSVAASPVWAICAGNQETVFACSLGAKHVELCLTPAEGRVTYRFGPERAPEIELTRDFDEITMQPWSGIGRSIWDRVTIPNGDYSYSLSWSYDKIDQEVSGGIEVARGETVLASLACEDAGEGGAIMELETLSFAMQDAGFCRSATYEALREGPCE
ncbi:hypothetical protein [Celeribacter halophilus]|uniref:Uncharacterized protein n=1 Tax=Celeribacter halophilus TaxID=576117 RepID=A0A1I3REC1_9RHOB|nr:hypothetical protein [Celeribacter halophilus]PZX12542.1 hypothetical protein LX82_01281 [Celeribacter halophilus]SFJ44638.1 hypothetical protein SAMN04488138_10543 [Celeribacter halophilus]